MKQLTFTSILSLLSLVLFSQDDNVGVGTTTPDPMAILDLVHSDKGLLIPRTDTAAINTAAGSTFIIPEGLLIFQSIDKQFYYFASGNWVAMKESTSMGGDTSTFETVNGVVRNTGDHATEDFVFGSDALPQNGVSALDTVMFFDKSKSAFRVGTISSLNWSPDSIGFASFASGANTKAEGDYSTAMGSNTRATGSNSTAMGNSSKALGQLSTAMGYGTNASGFQSTAIGNSTKASGNNSMAMGYRAEASGDYSTAMGERTVASGEYTTAMGRQTHASETGSTAMGTQTMATGASSTAMGGGTIASGSTSTSMGIFTVASGDNSMAMGTSTKASGHTTMAMGYRTEASGDRSTAMGDSTNALGFQSTTMGYGTNASGKISLATGRLSIASGDRSTAIGDETEASGYVSTAMGSNTDASGSDYSTAMGRSTKATGNASTAMGISSIASGENSTALGLFTRAIGMNSTAMSEFSRAEGVSSTAIGRYTSATGDYSVSIGRETDADAFNEVVIGSYNTIDNTANPNTWVDKDRIFTVGNGKNNSTRSDALVILKNGNVRLYDTLSIGADGSAYSLPTAGGMAGQALIANSDGNAFWSQIPSGSFETVNDVVRNKGLNQDFVFGRNTLPANGVSISGSLMFFDESKYAFRAGELLISRNWSPDNIGPGSFASGFNTKASGHRSTAMGNGTKASGQGSFAIGYQTEATAEWSVSMGFLTEATASSSTSMGYLTEAKGTYSTAIGRQTDADAYSEVAIGSYNTIDNSASPATWASTDRIFTVGNGTSASNRSDALVILKNGKVGIANNKPESALTIKENTTGGIELINDVSDGRWIVNNNGDLSLYLKAGAGAAISYRGAFDEISGYYSWTSDARLKQEVQDYQLTLDKLKQLSPKRYSYIHDPNKEKHIGFIAQELEMLYPEFVVKPTSENKFYSVNYAGLSVVAITAIKEQQELIEKQEVKIESQEVRIAKLEKLVQELVRDK